MFEFEGKFGIHFFYFILDSFSRTPWGLIFHEAGIIGFPFDIGAAGIPFASPLCLVPVIPVESFLAFSSFYGAIPYIQVVYFRTFLFGFRFGDGCSEIEIPVRSMLVEESAYVSFFTGYCYCCVAPIRQFITSCCSAVWLVSHHYLSESFVVNFNIAQFFHFRLVRLHYFNVCADECGHVFNSPFIRPASCTVASVIADHHQQIRIQSCADAVIVDEAFHELINLNRSVLAFINQYPCKNAPYCIEVPFCYLFCHSVLFAHNIPFPVVVGKASVMVFQGNRAEWRQVI